MLKDLIENLVKESITKSINQNALGELKIVPDSIAIEPNKNQEHGDRAINIAMRLSKEAKLPPRKIAEIITQNLDTKYFSKTEIAGPGFINLTLNFQLLEDIICEIHQQENLYGFHSSEQRADKTYSSILVEYVSANPTGDLHLGHGHQAVYGSSLANLLEWAGYKVSREFYINDAGAQIEKLGKSCRQAVLFQEGLLDKSSYDEENNYPLVSMLEFITPEVYKTLPSIDFDQIPENEFAQLAKRKFLEMQKEILKSIRVEFDKWYSESENLYQVVNNKTKVEKLCQKLLDNNHAYEKENAIWFKAQEFGDERDRVLKKSNGKFTYLAADLAYHQDKLTRGFDLLINTWGADHHGQVPGMKGALRALGYDENKLEVVLLQMVSLEKNGVEVKMSKRTGDIVTIRELVEEVGVDAFRFFLVESQVGNRIVFDLDLAKKQDKDNPVYYIQYAHARCCSIVRNLINPTINQEQSTLDKSLLDKTTLDQWQKSFSINQKLFEKHFVQLKDDALRSTRDLILALAKFPEEIKDAATARSPNKIANYAKELAGLFHQFYTHNRVINEDLELTKTRLSIVIATRIVLKNALDILGISAPEKM